jgi:hypothetical protein
MHRPVRAVFCGVALACASVGSAPAPSHAAAAWSLALQLPAGERIAERIDENDRVQWKLPERRLEKFRAGGAIITEQNLITTKIAARVVSHVGAAAILQGSSNVVSIDVPRHTLQSSTEAFTTALLPDNTPAAGGAHAIEDAAMAALPAQRVGIGSRWSTHLHVITTLGSGDATFDHEVTGLANGRLEIAVHGHGAITGQEYHLPKLLPGTIELDGTAWYDLATHLVTAESYAIRNRLIKPMEGEESGFDERLTVDTSTHVERSM